MTALLLALAALAADDPPAPTPTWADDVAAIVHASCTSCHRPGEAGPFPLITYDDVRRRARFVQEVTGARIMPPWHPVEGHGEFLDPLRLTDEEVDTIARWVDAGSPEGDPAAAPAPPEFPDGWALGEPDLVLEMTTGFDVPADGPDIYRSFVIPLGLPEDRWVTAVELRPSAPAVVHHCLFFLDDRGEARAMDAADPVPGFPSMRAGRAGSLGGWAVGGRPRHLPMDLAMPLPAGTDVVLNMHFHPTGKAETERSTIGLYFADEPPARTLVSLQLPPVFGAFAGLDIPAGDADYRLADEFELPVDVELVTVGGHAHYLGRELRGEATLPDGTVQPLFLIDDWDFDWQQRYTYAAPVPLPAGTTVRAEVVYDNSAGNVSNPFSPPRRVRWGLESTDEMGSVTFALVAADEEDTPLLRAALRAGRWDGLDSIGGRGRGGGDWRASFAQRVRDADADGDGRIARTEVPRALRRVFDRRDRNGDGFLDGEELEALGIELEPQPDEVDPEEVDPDEPDTEGGGEGE